MIGETPALASDQAPDAIPDIIAACARGNAYDPTFIASIWNAPPMKQAQDISAIAAGTEASDGVIPKTTAHTVSSTNIPIGRLSSAANLSAAHPPTK